RLLYLPSFPTRRSSDLLSSQPTSSVTVPVATSNTGEGLVSSAIFPTPAAVVNLTFTGSSWNVDQVVTVTGVNDTVTDPSHAYQIDRKSTRLNSSHVENS